MEQEPSGIIIFDGVCNFCNKSINFIISRDKHKQLRFAPRQSAAGQRLLKEHNIDPETVNSLVLIQAGKAYTKSTAVLRIVRYLNKLWPVFAIFAVVPTPLRDAIYGLVAKYRYKIAGTNATCKIPTADVRERFLTEEPA